MMQKRSPSRLSWRTIGLPEITRATVDTETPAKLATSRMFMESVRSGPHWFTFAVLLTPLFGFTLRS
jgi:hypothetical protein